jgi:hypothetical protein
VCGCIFALFAGFAPRLAFLFVWFFTPMVNRAFSGAWLWPLLGVVFLPFTALFYVFLYTPAGLSWWAWLIVLLGFLIDIGAFGGSAYGNRDRFSR